MFASTRSRRLGALTLSVPALLAVAACGGAPTLPATGPDRASGQSSLMDKTVAGQNAAGCDPKSHDRPFIVEWDATDSSQFESLASSDVVFVKYEGCKLQVIDSCKNDSVKGTFGAYKPVTWTSGSIEKVDIGSEVELHAKLPLGTATLGGRVSAGEKFHMEYFVAGTRNATRPAAYRADLAKVPGCRGVTHFVYAYALGAFALGSTKNIKGEITGSVWGAEAGAAKQQTSAAEKKGGVLASCRGESAKEVETCKAPIRLTLREIEDGENPDAVAAKAPETPSAANLAGKVDQRINLNEKAQEHYTSAMRKMDAGDGHGCIAELDKSDQADPRPNMASTSPASWGAGTRAQCLMLSGRCAAGKALMRKVQENHMSTTTGPEVIDMMVESIVEQRCSGNDGTERDRFVYAVKHLQEGTITKRDPGFCKKHYDTAKALFPKMTPRDEQDHKVKGAAMSIREYASTCFTKAGDCAQGWAAYRDSSQNLMKATYDYKAEFKRRFATCASAAQ
ncbi:MAG TPA: hypothetical protein PLR99_13815 [Polyangiaceae bacterium]|jgi:hypothetical protein|nr:hypothetical protein [Polyangiaceae bacterium]